ncbi:uncharacterized protein RB166_013483 isoform 2-T2 [Leptodactylus fuscus]|uniref:uncharacterized protein LOC142214316 isoform X2 n=1 Tax=Leptodactylus fuscus TaxID=238119 RepID=UPI003F4E6308
MLSTSSCGESRDVTGVVGGEVTLHVDRAGIRDISWVTQRNTKMIAVTKPGNVIGDVTRSYKGRLNTTYDGSLVITNLTTEDQGSYIASIMGSKQCIQMYNVTVYAGPLPSPFSPSHNFTADDILFFHNTSSGRHQHIVTKVVPTVIALIIIITAFLVFGYRQNLHPRSMCESNITLCKDDRDGSVWKINDIYSIESDELRIEDSSVH